MLTVYKLVILGDFAISSQTKPKLAPDLRDLFQTADLICVNFEAPVVSSCQDSASKVGPVITQSSLSLELCREWGISHLSLANNHIMDYGRDGLAATLNQLDDMAFFGAGLGFDQAYQPCWFEVSGTSVALLSFAEAQFGVLQDEQFREQPGYAWIDHPRARQAVRDARVKANWVIVQVHAGLEMVDLPLPEWRQRYRELIDLGADLVIGHHPHVIQGSECYKGRMIYYSLGNFYMDLMLQQSDSGSGAALVVTLGEEIGTEFIPLKTTLAEIGFDESGAGIAKYQQLSEKLTDDANYYAEIQGLCDAFWKQVYSGYYESSLCGLGTRPHYKKAYKLLRYLAGRILHGPDTCTVNELLLLHNIRIETHRWVVERALTKSTGRLQ